MAAVFEITRSNLAVVDPDNPNFSIRTGEARSRGLELRPGAAIREFSVDAANSCLDRQDADGNRAEALITCQGPPDNRLHDAMLGHETDRSGLTLTASNLADKEQLSFRGPPEMALPGIVRDRE